MRVEVGVKVDGKRVGKVIYAHLTGVQVTEGQTIAENALLGSTISPWAEPPDTVNGPYNECWDGPEAWVEVDLDNGDGCAFPGLKGTASSDAVALAVMGSGRTSGGGVSWCNAQWESFVPISTAPTSTTTSTSTSTSTTSTTSTSTTTSTTSTTTTVAPAAVKGTEQSRSSGVGPLAISGSSAGSLALVGLGLVLVGVSSTLLQTSRRRGRT